MTSAPAGTWPSTDANGIALVDPVTITHQGTFVVFARQQGAPINFLYYNVLVPNTERSATVGTWQGWNFLPMVEPSQADAPVQQLSADERPMLRIAGIDLITVSPDAVTPSPADAAFSVITDSKHISCFRVSTLDTLYVDRFVLIESRQPASDPQASPGGTSQWRLQRAWETRFRRSERRDIPAGTQDSLDSRNMIDQPFLEPTQEIAGLPDVAAGQFAVALTPTLDNNRRWNIFTVGANRITATSYPSDPSGRILVGESIQFAITPLAALAAVTQPLTCTRGASATTYEEQETATVAGEEPLHVRRATRLMLAVPTANAAIGLGAAMLVYDFLVQIDGTLPAWPAGVGCVAVDGSFDAGNKFVPAAAATSYPVPDSAIHAVGDATVSGALLGQQNAAARPTLFDSGDGLVHNYFAGTNNASPNFFVAQFNPLMTRAIANLPWQTPGNAKSHGNLSLVAQRAGTTFNGLNVTVGDCSGQADLCTVTVDYGTAAAVAKETWLGVPRALQAMAAILDGNGSNDAGSVPVQSVAAPFYDYSGLLKQARLPLGSSAAPVGYLTLVSHRPDMLLASAVVAVPANDHTSLTLTFAAGGGTITQTWANLPLDSSALGPILNGEADGGSYPYTPGGSDNALYGLATDGGAILLVAKQASPVITMTVGPASNLSALNCNISVKSGNSAAIMLTNVSRKQADVIAALQADAGITALFTFLSADPVVGLITDQSVAAALNLRGASTLFDVVSPATAGALVQTSVTQMLQQGHALNPPPGPKQKVPDRLVALAAVPIDLPQFGAAALVQNVTATVATPGQNGAWLGAMNPQALSLSGSDAVQVSLAAPAAPLLKPGRFWTIEAWCNPVTGVESRILAYNNGPATELAGVVPSYFVGTIGQSALQFQSYASSGGYGSSCVVVPADPQFDLASSKVNTFTWEALVNPQSPPCPAGSGNLGCIVEGQDNTYPATALFQFALDRSLNLVFAYRVNASGLATEQQFSSTVPLAAGTWSHVAVTGRNSANGWTFQLYINGRPAGQQTGVHFYADVGAPTVFIGASDIKSVSMFGNIAEVRCWQTARSQAEIARTMNTTLTGYEPGLFGYWPLIEKPGQGAIYANHAQITGTVLNASMKVSPQQAVASSLDGAFVSVVTGVGGAPAIQAHSFLRNNSWNHIAVVYQAAGALNMNPGDLATSRIDYGVCRNAAGLSFQTTNSIEAWVQIAQPATAAQTIFAQWGTVPADQAYQFGITSSGGAFCTVCVIDPLTKKPFAITANGLPPVCDGQPHHLAATWTTVAGIDINKNPTTTCTLSLYVDGVPQVPKVKVYQTPAISMVMPNSVPFTLGISALQSSTTGIVAIETQAPFVGVLTGLRFWAVALSADQVTQAMNAVDYGLSGLAAQWWFDEDNGIVAADSVGSNDITLSDTDMWSAFASIASTVVYTNGVLAGLTSPLATPAGYKGAKQLTIGAYQDQGSLKPAFNGQIAEVRIWKVARAQQQIQGGMNHPLSGKEIGLQAYWSFDATLADQTGRGNNAAAIGATSFVASTAPVANEGPAIRNVYNGPVTAFQETMMGTPGIVEYGDTGTNRDGSLYSVLYRRYAYGNPNLNLTENFSVGDLDLTYIGQAQSNPTLIGYIEGAPPVPSENLTRPLYNSYLGYNGYADCSTVALTQAETSTITFSSQDYKTSFSMDFDAKLGLMVSNKIDTGVAAVALWAQDAFIQKAKIGVHSKASAQMASQTDEKHVSAWSHTFTNQIGVRGYWEPQASNPDDYLNPVVGRRYQPLNIGYALVESITVDVYVMRMQATGAMVGRVAVPNPDIPPDKNILLFQIKPGYTKNGTLDGKVGFVNDPSYPSADTARGSYFKPKQAYILKAQAEREEQNLKTYFQQFDAVGQGESGNGEIGGQANSPFYDFGTNTARKSIANTYVWSSNGGLYKDEEQFSSISEKTYTGIYNMNWSIGAYVDAEFAVKVGVFAGLDLLFGGQIKVQVAKADSESRGFGLNVNVAGEPYIAAYDAKTQAYSYAPTPGKVLSYRFMTFYQPPSSANADAFMDEVVDRNWLDQSSDMDATVLRGAQIKGNAIWRVLHRVTYVSRVPPPASGNPVQSVGRAERLAIMLDNNQLLIGLVQRQLGNNKVPTPVQIGIALATILAPQDGSVPVLGSIVPWWTTFVSKATGQNAPPGSSALLTQILTDTYTYIQAGYSTGVLPIEKDI